MDEILKTVLLSGSLSAILVALLLWLLQDWISKRLARAVGHEYDVKLEGVKAQLGDALERQRTLLQQSLHVTKAQFDMEFESCKTLWAAMSKLIELSARMINAHLEFGISGNQSQLHNLAKEADSAFFESHKAVIEVAPFMPSKIKDVAARLNERCKHEIDYYFELLKPARPNLDEFDSYEAHKALKEAKSAMLHDYRTLEESIRDRLAAMAV